MRCQRTHAIFALCAMALGNFAGHANAQTGAPVALLEPYLVEGGELSSTNYGWLRWKFSADEAERAQWSELMRWAAATTEKSKVDAQEGVRALGYDPTNIKGGCGSDQTCEAILTSGFLHSIEDWSNAKSAIDEATPLFLAYLSGIRSIEASLAENEQRGLAAELLARRAIEQALRSAITNPEIMPAGLSANGVKAWRMLIWRETVKRDLANTKWLKVVVTSQGWPSKSKVGQEAAHAAWLLVQHADRDPAFQITALRLMEPLVTTGEVEPQNYAFLYDRVFGELHGVQRYGTQMVCSNGRFVPQEVEDPAGLPQRRERVGLPPLKEQLTRFASRTC